VFDLSPRSQWLWLLSFPLVSFVNNVDSHLVTTLTRGYSSLWLKRLLISIPTKVARQTHLLSARGLKVP